MSIITKTKLVIIKACFRISIIIKISYSTDSVEMNSNGSYTTSNTAALLEKSSFTTNGCGADYEFENCSSINLLSDQITPQDYTLLDMKYMQGYNYNEIGNEFNVSSNTISNRVNYIKTKLKKNNPDIME